MNTHRLLVTSVLLLTLACNVIAQPNPRFQIADSVIAAAFPEQRLSPWTAAEGDLNGDGIPDMAIVLTGWIGGQDPRGERLVVLIGNRDKSYTVLSMSDEFCNAREFYNLSIEKRSLVVEAFWRVSDRISSSTLHFRYNHQLMDLELIGAENLSEENVKVSSYKISTNYLNGKVIHTRRDGKKYKEAQAWIDRKPLSRLQGVACESYWSSEQPSININERFVVERR